MKQTFLILFAACAIQPALADKVIVDFMDVEQTSWFEPLTISLNESVSIECDSAMVNNNLFLTEGTYMFVKGGENIAIKEIKFNFRPADCEGEEVDDRMVYKFDTESNMCAPGYNSCVICPSGEVSNPDYNTMIWNAADMSLSQVGFRNMRDNNGELAIESVEVSYAVSEIPCALGLPYIMDDIKFDSEGWFHSPVIYVGDDSSYTLCDVKGTGEYEVYLLPENEDESTEKIELGVGDGSIYNAESTPQGYYRVAVKSSGMTDGTAMVVTRVPGNWPAERPMAGSIGLSEEIWHNVLVEVTFPSHSWDGKPLQESEVNFFVGIINGTSEANAPIDQNQIMEGTGVIGWTGPCGKWSMEGVWRYGYRVNAISMLPVEGELTVVPLASHPDSETVFSCKIDGATYYNQFSTITKEKTLKGNLAGEDFPYGPARPSSKDYSYGWYVAYNNIKALRLDYDADCWLIFPVLSLEGGKGYEVSFENEGIDASKEPEIAIIPIREELSFDNMANGTKGVNSENYDGGIYAATLTPAESGAYYIGLRINNCEGENYRVNATISKITVTQKEPSAIESITLSGSNEGYYDMMGRKVNNPKTGDILVKVSEGRIRKIVVR